MAQREREGRSDSFGERSARDVGIPVAVLQVGHADHGAAGVGGTAWPIAQLSLECFASQRRLIGRGHVVLFARPVADGVSDAIRYAGSRHSRVSLSGAEPVPAASEAEVPRSLEVGTDPCMALTDLGALQVGVKCMEHRSMSFLSRIGTLVGARDDARIRRSGAPRRRAKLEPSGSERAHGARRPAGNLHNGVEHRHGHLLSCGWTRWRTTGVPIKRVSDTLVRGAHESKNSMHCAARSPGPVGGHGWHVAGSRSAHSRRRIAYERASDRLPSAWSQASTNRPSWR
jgi:hypothetical protein